MISMPQIAQFCPPPPPLFILEMIYVSIIYPILGNQFHEYSI